MGCCESRHRSSEERAILHEEESLKFHIVDVEHIDMIIRKHSNLGMVNNFQLQRIASALRIETNNYKNHSKIASFYNKLKDDSGEISETDLLVLAIMLGKGTPAIKSQLLFQVFDIDGKEVLTLEQVKDSLLKGISRASLLLAFLVSDNNNIYSNELKISGYIQKLKTIETDAIEDCAKILNTKAHDSNVSEARFIESFRLMEEGTLTSPGGWRSFLHKKFLSVPPKKVTHNPFARKKK